MTRSATPGRTAGPERSKLVRLTGLAAAGDDGMDRFARLAVRLLGVPVALVALLEEDRQTFPGARGLAEPWASTRTAPLSHAPWQAAVTAGRPFVVPDLRRDGAPPADFAAVGLDVAACAAMPLTDGEGTATCWARSALSTTVRACGARTP